MSLIPPSDGTPPPPASPPVPPSGQEPAASPPAGDPPPPPAGDRPEWVPETLWKDGKFDAEAFDALQSRPEPQADVPATADAYKMPEIEGFDTAAAAESPLFKALMAGAHANKVGQAAFEGIVQDYVTGETAKAEAHEAEQLRLLGSEAANRLKTVASWLDRALPAEKAAALRAATTTAAGVEALEELMNAGTRVTPRDNPPPPQTGKTREQILEMMKDVRYRGKPEQRDAAFVREIDDWFAANAPARGKGGR